MDNCPYKGLTPFAKEDAKYFAGRDRETKLAISLLYGSSLSASLRREWGGKDFANSRRDVAGAGKRRAPGCNCSFSRLANIPLRSEPPLNELVLKSLLICINRLRGEANLEPIHRVKLIEALCQSLEVISEEELFQCPLDRFLRGMLFGVSWTSVFHL